MDSAKEENWISFVIQSALGKLDESPGGCYRALSFSIRNFVIDPYFASG